MSDDVVFCGVRRSLLVSMIVVPALTLLLAAAIGLYSYSTTTERLAVGAIQQVAVDHGDMIDDFLDERRGDLESFFEMFYREIGDGVAVQTVAERMFWAAGGVFKDLGVIAPDGIQAAYVGEFALAGKEYGEAPWYRETLKNGYYVSDVFLGYRNVPHFVVAVTRRIGEKMWVLRATINSQVFRQLVEKVSIGDTGEAYILDRNGFFQTVRRSGGELLERDVYEYPVQTNSIMTFMGTEDGVDYLFASALLNDGKWRLIVRQKRSDAFHSAIMAGYIVLLILLCGGGGIVGLAFMLSRRVAETLRRQTEAVCSLENQLLQAARLAELGEMSAGFAHEINNPLQIMKTDLALLDMTLKDLIGKGADSALCAELTEIAEQFEVQIGRCAAITREILRFGRQDAPQLQRVDLVSYLPEVGAMVEKKAAVNGVSLHCEVDETVPAIEADPGQLQQVMINLLNNAIHAVQEKHGASGGEINVTAGRDEKGNAVISVTDNGRGISSDILDKIFLPFLPPRAPGQGTGMGLAVCHSIIDSLGGELRVQSDRGVGTVFTITVPEIKASTGDV